MFCTQPFDQCSSLLCSWSTVQDGAVRCSALNHVINAVLYCVVGARFKVELFGVLRSTMLSMQFCTVLLEHSSGWSCSMLCAQPCDQCSSVLCSWRTVQNGAVRCSAHNYVINAVLYCVVGAWSTVQEGAVRCAALNHVINAVLYCVYGARFRMELFGVLHSTMHSMQFCTV